MTLESGTYLGHYEITNPIGKGGMGEVYRARDTKLGREVAIKVLPAEFARDPERLARLEREARMLAALNHPNIAAIHGLEESNDTRFLVLELVGGDTLADRLGRGAIPVEESLRLALQIAEALEAAHEKGVIHRDLKPANIKITPEGRVKVLDFGLAKAFIGEQADVNLSHSPTLSMAATQAGIILGTAAYMSPEQASGEVADHRADIWSFGVVLYEMLTGRQLFTGKTASHVMGAVLERQPDWSALPPGLHPRVRELLERLLEKEARNRLSGISDARVEIERALADPAGGTRSMTAGTRPARSVLAWVAGTALVCFLLSGLAAWLLLPEQPARNVVRFSTALGEDQIFTRPELSMVTISPDGRRMAYVANNQIHVRNFDETEARPVAGTNTGPPGPATPVFSPDGEWLAYVQVLSPVQSQLRRVPVTGGTPQTIFEEGLQAGLSWPAQESMVFAGEDGIVRIPANGGAVDVLVPGASGQLLDSPQLLAGDQILYSRVDAIVRQNAFVDGSQIVIQSIGGDDATVLREGGGAAKYLPTGHLVYAQGDTLFAIPFDPGTRTFDGGAVPMVEDVRRSTLSFSDTANYAVSDTGTLVWTPGGLSATDQRQSAVAWVDREGNVQEIARIPPSDYVMARVSPNGERILLLDGGGDLWIYDLATENLTHLTSNASFPVWAPDGQRVLFAGTAEGAGAVLAIPSSGGDVEVVATSPEYNPLPWSISRDGETLLVLAFTDAAQIEIATLSMSDGTLTTILSDSPVQNEPALSPNGEWIAYFDADLTGAAQISLRPFPDVRRSRQPVGPSFARHAIFSADGSELFYFDFELGEIWSVPIEYEPTFRVGVPERVFAGDYWYGAGGPTGGQGRAWDLDPTVDRFVMIMVPRADGGATGEPAPAPTINVTLNWFEELKERVPVR